MKTTHNDLCGQSTYRRLELCVPFPYDSQGDEVLFKSAVTEI